MKKTIVCQLLLFSVVACAAQALRNPVYALHNMIKGDSVYNTPDKQVGYVKQAGFDGIEISGLESFESMYEAIKTTGVKAGYFYFKLNLDTPYIDPGLPGYIRQLKGTKFILAPYIPNTKANPAGTHGADTLVIRLLRDLAGWAESAGLQVAIYPHRFFYVERFDHAVALARQVNKSNLGVSFNLCHWLATTNSEERATLQTQLKTAAPHIKMIIINGANNVVSQKPVIWEDYILPLGSGDFDTYGLLRYALVDLKMKVPVAIQCYNIKSNKAQLVQTSIRQWQTYKQQLQMINK
ncbi:sugar phosphate isomerase/epimerase family protein [Flavitalea antarctica]